MSTWRGMGERVDGSGADSFGFGATAELRLPEVLGALRPLVYGQIERIGPESCDADASCFFAEARIVKAVAWAWPGASDSGGETALRPSRT